MTTQPTTKEVAHMFIRQYYQTMIGNSNELFKFYEPQSSVSYMYDDEQGETAQGLENIKLVLGKYNSCYKDSKVKLSRTKAQLTVNGSILLVISGEVDRPSQPYTFTQSFVLGKQNYENAYYVANDILICENIKEAAQLVVKEEVEEEQSVKEDESASKGDEDTLSSSQELAPQESSRSDDAQTPGDNYSTTATVGGEMYQNFSDLGSDDGSMSQGPNPTTQTPVSKNDDIVKKEPEEKVKNAKSKKKEKKTPSRRNKKQEKEDKIESVSSKENESPAKKNRNKKPHQKKNKKPQQTKKRDTPPPPKKKKKLRKKKPRETSYASIVSGEKEESEYETDTDTEPEDDGKSQKKKKEKEIPRNTVHIGGLDQDVTDEDIINALRNCGGIVNIEHSASSPNSKKRKFVYVEFKDYEGFHTALSKSGRVKIKGKRVKVTKRGEKVHNYNRSRRNQGRRNRSQNFSAKN